MERLTRGVLKQDELRLERFEVRGDRAVDGLLEPEVRHHPEPLPGGVEMRLDLREQLVRTGVPNLCGRPRCGRDAARSLWARAYSGCAEQGHECRRREHEPVRSKSALHASKPSVGGAAKKNEENV